MKHKHSTIIDVTSLFHTVGIDKEVRIRTNEHTYEVDLTYPKHNWVYPAFCAFQKLSKELTSTGRQCQKFVTIGTGPGIDAIGAHYIFKPQQIILTDIHPDVLPLAETNYLNNLKKHTPYQIYTGHLCEPLYTNNIQADIIYANLPNIPYGNEDILDSMLTSSYYNPNHTIQEGLTNLTLSAYLLSLQNAFLMQAHNQLCDEGSVIINLGARVPLPIVKDMFLSNGYIYQELYAMFKIQSQPMEVLRGYANAENKYGVTFDFYIYDKSQEKIEKDNNAKTNITTEELKKELRPYRVSATESYQLFTKNGTRIGHVVQLIRGIKR